LFYLLVLRLLASDLVEIDVDLARRPDVAHLETIGLKAILD
jgi:hypothetical protein